METNENTTPKETETEIDEVLEIPDYFWMQSGE